jgi:hypothetical protein
MAISAAAYKNNSILHIFGTIEVTLLILWARMKVIPSEKHDEGILTTAYIAILMVIGLCVSIVVVSIVNAKIGFAVREINIAETWNELVANTTALGASFGLFVNAVIKGDPRRVLNIEGLLCATILLGMLATVWTPICKGFRNTASKRMQSKGFKVIAIIVLVIVLGIAAYSFGIIPENFK